MDWIFPIKWQLAPIGVCLFFVLSGFCVELGYGTKEVKVSYFIRKRIIKLYPIYAFTMLIGLGLAIVGHKEFCSIAIDLLLNSVLLQTLIPSFQSLNGIAWYVATISWLYLIYALVLRKLNSPTLITAMLIYMVLLDLLRPHVDAYGQTLWFYTFSPYSRVVEFCMGVLGARIFHNTKNTKLSQKQMVMLEGGIISAIVVYVLIDNDIRAHIWILSILYTMAFYVFSFQEGAISKFFSGKIFSCLSPYSYAFYMIHGLCYIFFMALLDVREKNYSILNITTVLLSIITAVVASYTIKYYDEKIQKKIKNI